ncbi:hypothetical protein GEMRC1_002741 [Eukaryota sp. GEM-RC1]
MLSMPSSSGQCLLSALALASIITGFVYLTGLSSDALHTSFSVFPGNVSESIYLSAFKWSSPASLHLSDKVESVSYQLSLILPDDLSIESVTFLNTTEQFNNGRICHSIDNFKITTTQDDLQEVFNVLLTLTSGATRVVLFWIWTPLLIVLIPIGITFATFIVSEINDLIETSKLVITLGIICVLSFGLSLYFAPIMMFEHFCGKDVVT